MTKPSLLVINQYYAPDLASTGRYAAGLCSGLVERGWRVRVVCGQPSYSRGRMEWAPNTEVLDGAEVHRVSLSGVGGRDSIPRRFLGYTVFMLRAWREAARLASADRPDVVMTFHNPPFVGLIGRRLSRQYKVPFVYCPFDILPDVVKAAGWPLPEAAFRLWNRINAAIYDAADSVVVLDKWMKRVLIDKGVEPGRLSTISLWALPDLSNESGSSDLRRRLGLDQNALLLLYAGNMGYMHSLDSILDAAVMVRDEPIYFVCLGEGPARAAAERRIAVQGLSRVWLLGYQPEPRFRSFVTTADAAFVSIRSGSELLGTPSRALCFLSAGTPIVALTRRMGSLCALIDSTHAGWLVTSGSELAELLRRMQREPRLREEAAKRCRIAYRRRFGRDRSVAELNVLLDRALKRRTDAGDD